MDITTKNISLRGEHDELKNILEIIIKEFRVKSVTFYGADGKPTGILDVPKVIEHGTD